MEVREAINLAEEKLKNAGVNDWKTDAKLIYMKLFNVNDLFFIMNGRKEITKEDEEKYFIYIEKRSERVPLQEIFGETEFYGLPFRVNRSVLTPRLETELVLEKALEVIRDLKGKSVLDICTGSGILGICIKHDLPELSVTLSDISEDALKTAAENAELNGTDVEIVRSDMFKSISGKYDMIVSNPPYITLDEMSSLEPEVLNYDPRIALTDEGDGLSFYRIIAEEGISHLNENGAVVLEIGYNQGETVADILRGTGRYRKVEYFKDYSGNDRIAVAYI